MVRHLSGLRVQGPTLRMTLAKSGSTFFRCRIAFAVSTAKRLVEQPSALSQFPTELA